MRRADVMRRRFVEQPIPLQINDCVLWLDADSINQSDNTIVELWNDKSGSGNHFDAVSGNEPKFFESGFNSKPSVYFNGLNQFLKIDSSIIFPKTSDFTIIAVINHDQTPNGDDRVIWGTGINPNDRTYMYSTTTFGSANDEQRLWASNNAQQLVWGADIRGLKTIQHVSRNGNNFSLFNNGSLTHEISLDRTFTDYSRFELGAGFADSRFYAGYVSEFLIYHKSISGDERNVLNEYLTGKWAIE